MTPIHPIIKQGSLVLMTSKIGSNETNQMTGDNVTDYVCIAMWDPIFEMMRYHWVHKSEKNPVQFVKSLNPEQEVL